MIRAADLMTRHLVCVSSSTSVAAALKLINSAKVSLMPVVDDGILCGIVYETDLESRREPGLKVKSVMSDPVFVERDAGIEDVSKALLDNGIGRMPVVDSRENMECVGIISSTDVLRSMKKGGR